MTTAPLLDYLANAGCLRPMRSIRDRDLLVHDIVMFQIIHRVQGPFQRYSEVLVVCSQINQSSNQNFTHRPTKSIICI